MPHSNGTGARPPEVFEFSDTGYTVQYRRVSLQLYIDFEMGWRRKNPPPSVPAPVVEISGEKRAVANPADPDYQQALGKYEEDVRSAQYHFLWKRAIVLTPEDRQEVKQLREEVQQADGIELDTSDEWVYLFNIAVGSPDELDRFQKLVFRISQPTKEAVDDAKATFQNTGGGR